ncbi:uncharacterized protein LOC129327751 isoform X1 [Eublepharis macularius]|nr:uncharacterized protein LOC129327751 isoform X1 [Eublepharis macularius]
MPHKSLRKITQGVLQSRFRDNIQGQRNSPLLIYIVLMNMITVQRSNGSRTLLGGPPPFLPPQGTGVVVAMSGSIPSAVLSAITPRSHSATVWDNSVLAAEERRGIPKAPEERDVKAKSVGIRGPLICYTANQANATLDLIIKSGGRPANDLLTLNIEVYLKITFEASGNYLIVKLSLDSPDDLLISSPVAGTNVNRYIQWSEAMVRKTLNALNRMYQDQVPTLRTKQHMNNTAVADSQGMLHIHVID